MGAAAETPVLLVVTCNRSSSWQAVVQGSAAACAHAHAGPIFMFPGALAEGPFSLRAGEPCCALSLSAELGPGGELIAQSACASTVVPTLRMTYDDVDAAVSGGDLDALTPELRALLEVCAVCRLPTSPAAQATVIPCVYHSSKYPCVPQTLAAQRPWCAARLRRQASRLRQGWRERQGAANIALDECQVRVDSAAAQDPTVRLERLNMWDSPARNMVAELMILAGQVAATLGAPARLFRLACCLRRSTSRPADSCM